MSTILQLCHEYSTPAKTHVATPKEHALIPVSIAQRRMPEKARKQSTSLDTRDDDMPCVAYMQFRPTLIRLPWFMNAMTTGSITMLKSRSSVTGRLCGKHNCRLCMAAELQNHHEWQRNCPWPTKNSYCHQQDTQMPISITPADIHSAYRIRKPIMFKLTACPKHLAVVQSNEREFQHHRVYRPRILNNI